MNTVLEEIRKDLIKNADEKVRLQGERFFKEKVTMYGIKSAQVTRISKDHFVRLSDKSKLQVFRLCEELLKTGLMEESFVACHWSYRVRNEYTTDDFRIFERWVNSYVNNWATCDTFCNHSVGELLLMYPVLLPDIKTWAISPNRWVRRASAVSFILPAKKGKFLDEIFEIAEILHSDNDDMVQKGYGWMLKAASQAHQKEVFDYVMKRKSTMPRTSLRYAIEKMPQDLKSKAMAK